MCRQISQYFIDIHIGTGTRNPFERHQQEIVVDAARHYLLRSLNKA